MTYSGKGRIVRNIGPLQHKLKRYYEHMRDVAWDEFYRACELGLEGPILRYKLARWQDYYDACVALKRGRTKAIVELDQRDFEKMSEAIKAGIRTANRGRGWKAE